MHLKKKRTKKQKGPSTGKSHNFPLSWAYTVISADFTTSFREIKLGQQFQCQGLVLTILYRTHCWDGQNQLCHQTPPWQDQPEIPFLKVWRDHYTWTELWVVLPHSSRQWLVNSLPYPHCSLFRGFPNNQHVKNTPPSSSPHSKQRGFASNSSTFSCFVWDVVQASISNFPFTYFPYRNWNPFCCVRR